ncbi:MAG: hypothetical protein K2P78_13015, partial [Gemmataceae bacterium]|nr:hypothetical protein [Gemmataceae bacterium]
MDDLFSQVGHLFLQVVTNLTNPEAWKAALSGDGVTAAAFIVLALIVFMETGLLTFFLPGDSLLVTPEKGDPIKYARLPPEKEPTAEIGPV